MKNFYILTDAINYIEDNLCNDFTLDDIAASCYSSLSGLKKLFRYALHHGLKEYISKRRITHAAHDLLNTDLSVTEIAMKYQYNSPEVFTRAFSKVWGTTPSAFKKQWKFSGIFPRILFEYDGGEIMSKKNVDLSELYDLLKSRTNSYVLCFDMICLKPINDTYGHEAGDKAILECLRRIDTLSDDNCILFRIGGDEFALVTDLQDPKKVEVLAKRILKENGQPILYSNTEIPIGMRIGCTRIVGSNIRYSNLYANLYQAIEGARDNNECYYIA
ncbi:diguanylate cyclase [Mobilitalea sibirica]|uniref:Diguanylate cyclase n=1 Tax=Mobilitalea sibirica TaxID=1462919 RepID=A0A8J7KX52_9FIRM|nr:diguanylate cyclase [Mobilitalea sibirica]MBH1942115.1 diguanylate cyclase [Mobilitalea sibirica]